MDTTETLLGYIYVLSNPAMPDLLKIGFTRGAVESRARDLSRTTGIPQAFEVESWYLTQDPSMVEKKVHQALADHRVNDGREFFRVTVEIADKVVAEHIKPPMLSFQRPTSERKLYPKYQQVCRRCGALKPEGAVFCDKCGF